MSIPLVSDQKVKGGQPAGCEAAIAPIIIFGLHVWQASSCAEAIGILITPFIAAEILTLPSKAVCLPFLADNAFFPDFFRAYVVRTLP